MMKVDIRSGNKFKAKVIDCPKETGIIKNLRFTCQYTDERLYLDGENEYGLRTSKVRNLSQIKNQAIFNTASGSTYILEL